MSCLCLKTSHPAGLRFDLPITYAYKVTHEDSFWHKGKGNSEMPYCCVIVDKKFIIAEVLQKLSSVVQFHGTIQYGFVANFSARRRSFLF